MSRFALLCSCLALVGCNEVQPPQVLVHFEAEAETAENAVELRYEVRSAGRVVGGGTVRLGMGAGEISFPMPPIPVLPKNGDTSRLFDVRGVVRREVVRGNGDVELEFLNEASVTTGFGPGLSNITLLFSDICLGSDECPPGETCGDDGMCVPIPFEQARGSNPRQRRSIRVNTLDSFRAAYLGAQEGDIITVAPGDYPIGRSLPTMTGGSQFAPIIVRAAEPGTVNILVQSDPSSPSDGFLVTSPYWVFENLNVQGVCPADAHVGCDHGFHIAGDGHHVVLRNNIIFDFNQPIKSNASDGAFPDNVIVENNTIYNTATRNAGAQRIAGMFILASSDWVIRGNHFYGFLSDSVERRTVAAVDIASGSRKVTFERNLVECDDEGSGIPRLGVSYGRQGEEDDPNCRDRCIPSAGGIIRNNILRCDTPLLVDSAGVLRIAHNTLVRGGLGVVRAVSNVSLHANLSAASANIDADSAGLVTSTNNVAGDLSSWLAGPPANLRPVSGAPFDGVEPNNDALVDYCDEARSARPSVGAVDIASSCNTNEPPPNR